MKHDIERAEQTSAGSTRREFLKTGLKGAGGLVAASLLSGAANANSPAVIKRTPPNILFINVDQLSLESLGVFGCSHVNTPNIDRLAKKGVAFSESYSANPVCCPARASWHTGRMSSEHAVVENSLPLLESLPDLGQWLGENGYQTIHAGKWHVPGRNLQESFDIVYGHTGYGEYSDTAVARVAESFLYNRTGSDPFYLVTGFLQPHDICFWGRNNQLADERILKYKEIVDQLPPLPPNFNYDPAEPKLLATYERENWTELQWRYYIWAYYRHVEMVDAAIGLVLNALENSRYRDNTLVLFASDHGEGHGRHQMTLKRFLYDEAARVPIIFSYPGEILSNKIDKDHIVSGVDVAPTLCDFAGVKGLPKQRGQSLRPLLEGKASETRSFAISESAVTGRMVRTPGFKYICYKGDPTAQLFDMKNDPWETRNLAAEQKYASVIQEHKQILEDWEQSLDPAPVPEEGWKSVVKRRI